MEYKRLRKRKMFTPLEVKSAFSLLKSPIHIKEYVAYAKSLGYRTVAISEWETMASAILFYEECKKQGVKPIISINFELYGQEMIALAKNTSGYFELILLSSLLLNDVDQLKDKNIKYSKVIELINNFEHVIFILSGHVTEKSIEIIQKQLQHKILLSVYANQENVALGKLYRLPMIINHKVEYLLPNQYQLKRVLNAINDNIELPFEKLDISGTNYLMSSQSYYQQFNSEEMNEYLHYTQKLLDEIELNIPVQQKLLPQFDKDSPRLLKEKVYEGLKKRQNKHQLDLQRFSQKEYINRLEKELDIIISMGFADYFLIVWDLMNYAHEQNIMTGAGRGSSAASLVSYCLNITQVDPVKYDLLFERFLNPERYTMPDIDIDFPDNKRQQMIEYVTKKYGADKVAQISTFGTLAPRQALRDVARVFGCTSVEMKQLSNAVLYDRNITLEKCYETSKRFRDIVDKTPKLQKVFQIAKEIEGLPRHISTHAAAVVISDRALNQLVPMQKIGETYLTQFTMQDVEHVGLLKMDFLGLKNLSILSDSVSYIQKENADFDIWDISFDDEKVFNLFSKGDTNGIFQFESSGIKNTLKQVKPNTLLYLTAVNALYRPGPMENIKSFADRKHHKEAINYPHHSLDNILEQTHGIIVYQEQVMQIAYQMAGFSLGQADLLRRAIGKMKKDVMIEQRANFIQGALQQGYSEKDSIKVYDYIEKFANYGFPKSHALAYSILAYQLAYIKLYYPIIFYTVLLKHTPIKTEKFNTYLMEAKRKQFKIMQPNINQSFLNFTYMKNTILFGLSSISGIKHDMRNFIIKERIEHGTFTSFSNFLYRLDTKFKKREYIELLIFSGALDCFGENRATLIQNIDTFSMQNIDLFKSDFTPKMRQVAEYTKELLKEKELAILGYSFMPSIQDEYQQLYNDHILNSSIEVKEINDQRVRLLGEIISVNVIKTKNNKRMAFVKLDDSYSVMELVFFSEMYVKYISDLVQKKIVCIEGVAQNREEEISVVVKSLVSDEALSKKLEHLQYQYYLKLNANKEIDSVLNILKKYPGDIENIVFLAYENKYKKIPEKFNVDGSEQFEQEIRAYLDAKNVKKINKYKK